MNLKWQSVGAERQAGGLPTSEEDWQITAATYEATLTTWRCRVGPVPEGWGGSVGRFRYANAKAKGLAVFTLGRRPDGFWTFGPFDSEAEAQRVVMGYLKLRIDPATWRAETPPISHDSEGHFFAQDCLAWIK